MHDRPQTLTPRFEMLIQNGLDSLGYSYTASLELAASVQKLSDFYVDHPGAPTPWNEGYALPATLSYFMPLNFVRLRSVFKELERFFKDEEISQVWDFGSGLGTTHWVLEESFLSPKPFFEREVSRVAQDFYLKLVGSMDQRWKARLGQGRPEKGAIAVCSYSFLEMHNELPPLEEFDHWLILEPSTREAGRDLMEARSKFLAAGFTALAPCTHNQPCPLLTHSDRDWCHNRIHFETPEWWRAIEDNLPMKNRTLTYSYLLVSKANLVSLKENRFRGATRVIGDTLEERGKTRQLACRGSEREFLPWLHKHGEAPRIPHGALIPDLGEFENKSGELRVSPAITWVE